MIKKLHLILVFATLFIFAAATFMESMAWARAGGGRGSGSRGGRSFSSPQMPSSSSRVSPGMSTTGQSPFSGNPAQGSGNFFSRSPFLQGMAGGLAGGMLGSLLFGGVGHAGSGGIGRGGIGLMDIIILGVILYLAYRFFKRRRAQNEAVASAHFGNTSQPRPGGNAEFPRTLTPYLMDPLPETGPSSTGEADRGFGRMGSQDAGFDEERFKETAQDLFFRIQAGWTNRSLEGIENILTKEMAEFFRSEFETLKQKGIINRLENIAIRRVELSEAWQEPGKDFITVLITANLLDYTVNAETREVVQGDRMNPVKFQEFWTFCREGGSAGWRLSAINQMEQR